MSFYYEAADPRALRENVPADMRPMPVFLLWSEERAAKAGDKARKVPHYIDGGKRGKTGTGEDRERLATFDDAIAADEREDRPWRGLGAALGEIEPGGDQLCGIDLDKCRSASGGLPRSTTDSRRRR